MTIAQGFSLAYQSWQLATKDKRAEFRQESRLREGRDGVEGDIPGTILIEVGGLLVHESDSIFINPHCLI